MKRTYAFRDGQFVEITPDHVKELHYVQPDISEFRSPDGAHIKGRADWREHLRKTGTVEVSHSDIAAGRQVWAKKKAAFAEKLTRAEKVVRPVDVPVVDSPDREPTRLNIEIRNRLEGRPAPDRLTLLKLTWETAEDLRRRK